MNSRCSCKPGGDKKKVFYLHGTHILFSDTHLYRSVQIQYGWANLKMCVLRSKFEGSKFIILEMCIWCIRNAYFRRAFISRFAFCITACLAIPRSSAGT